MESVPITNVTGVGFIVSKHFQGAVFGIRGVRDVDRGSGEVFEGLDEVVSLTSESGIGVSHGVNPQIETRFCGSEALIASKSLSKGS
jgi:hypothetical protein